MRALASGSQANGQGGNIHGVVLAVLTGEEQIPWLGQPGAVCMKTYNHQRDDQKNQSKCPLLPPHFVLNLFTFACRDSLFPIVKIHRANLLRIPPIL